MPHPVLIPIAARILIAGAAAAAGLLGGALAVLRVKGDEAEPDASPREKVLDDEDRKKQ